jgi:hypothetical protein
MGAMKKAFFLVLLALAAFPAQARTIDLAYDIRFMGLSIGDIHYTITLDGDAYTLTFDGGFGGLVGLFADAGGKATTTGRIKNGKVLPTRMDQTVTWGEKERQVWIAFNTKGDVTDYGAMPHYSPEGRVPVEAAMLTDVRDTLSAMLYEVRAGEDFCARTQRVFDGRERYDLRMESAGEAMHCRVTPVQIGGHKVNDADAKNPPKPFKMTFIAIGDGALAVPFKTVKPFTIGNATIKLAKITER